MKKRRKERKKKGEYRKGTARTRSGRIDWSTIHRNTGYSRREGSQRDAWFLVGTQCTPSVHSFRSWYSLIYKIKYVSFVLLIERNEKQNEEGEGGGWGWCTWFTLVAVSLPSFISIVPRRTS